MRTPGLALAVAALAMTGLVGNAAALSTRNDKPRKDPRRSNEQRWDEMTQADIDRLTAAHEKRKRKAKRQAP